MSFQVLCSLKSHCFLFLLSCQELYIPDTKLYQRNMVCKYFFHFSGLSFYFLAIALGSTEFLIFVTSVSLAFPCCLSFGCCEMSGFSWKAQGSPSSLVKALSLCWYSLMRRCHHTSGSLDMLSFSPVAKMRPLPSPTRGPLGHSFCCLGLVPSPSACVMLGCSWELAVFGSACQHWLGWRLQVVSVVPWPGSAPEWLSPFRTSVHPPVCLLCFLVFVL